MKVFIVTKDCLNGKYFGQIEEVLGVFASLDNAEDRLEEACDPNSKHFVNRKPYELDIRQFEIEDLN